MAGAGLVNRAGAQEIGTNSNPVTTFPATVGSTPENTNAPNSTPPLLLPAPRPLAPSSALFTPVVPYGGGVSQTGESLAQALQEQNANQSYNLRLGGLLLRAEADTTVTVNDNIGLSKDNRETDILVSPMGVLHGRYNVSAINSLTFNIGIGYQAYLLHPQYDCVLIAPDSEVNFNLFVGDVAVNLHDSFSYEQDPTQVGQLSNQVRLSRFMNDAGVSATWDLDEFSFEADYDHSNLWVLDSVYNYLTDQSDTIAPKMTIKLDETLSTGLSASFSDTRYQQSFENDNTNESFGPFVTATFSNFLSLNAAAGGYLTQYDHGGGNGDNSGLASYYANLGINHEITQFLSESLTAGKEYLPGLTSNYTSRIYVNYSDQWSPTKQIGLGASVFWENLSDSDATARQTSDRYGLNLNLTDALNDHLRLNLGYEFLLKESDPSYLSYYQDVGTLGMQYNF